MKKVVLTLVVLLLTFTNVPAKAADQTIHLDNLNMDITLPVDYQVLSQNLISNEVILNSAGFDEEQMTAMYKQNHIYLSAIKDMGTIELSVNMQENQYSKQQFDNNLADDATLLKAAEDFTKSDPAAQMGRTYQNPRILQGKQAKFIAFDIRQPLDQGEIRGKQYTTIINGQAISILLNCYGTDLTSALETETEQMVNHISFTQVQKKTIVGTFWAYFSVIVTILAATGLTGYCMKKALDKRNVLS